MFANILIFFRCVFTRKNGENTSFFNQPARYIMIMPIIYVPSQKINRCLTDINGCLTDISRFN